MMGPGATTGDGDAWVGIRRKNTLQCVKYRRGWCPSFSQNQMIEIDHPAEIADLERSRLADSGESYLKGPPLRVQELIAKCAARPDLQPELKAMLAAYFEALFED